MIGWKLYESEVPVDEFRYSSYAQEIIFGPGSINRLREAVDRFHWDRLLLCSTGSQRRSGIITLIERALDGRLVAIYEHVQPHVPDFQIAEVLELADENEIDAVTGLGGGSPIGMAKALSLELEEMRTFMKSPFQADMGSLDDFSLAPNQEDTTLISHFHHAGCFHYHNTVSLFQSTSFSRGNNQITLYKSGSEKRLHQCFLGYNVR